MPSTRPPPPSAGDAAALYPTNKPICKFFNSPKGCRNGAQCRFRHENLPVNHGETAVNQSSASQPSESIQETKQPPLQRQQRRKCKFFNVKPDGCKLGNQCPFLHVDAALNTNANQTSDSDTNRHFHSEFKRTLTLETQTQDTREPARPQRQTQRQHTLQPDNQRQDPTLCQFFFSETGCAMGALCPFKHIQPESQQQEQKPPQTRPPIRKVFKKPEQKGADSNHPLERAAATRNAELKQLERRFRSSFRLISGQDSFDNAQSDCVLEFDLSPSDPDFPYDIEVLQIRLVVPAKYPIEQAQLFIQNSDIPDTFKTNITNGWKRKVDAPVKSSLLDMMKWLDRNLEELLKVEHESMKITVLAPRDIAKELSELKCSGEEKVERMITGKLGHESLISEHSPTAKARDRDDESNSSSQSTIDQSHEETEEDAHQSVSTVYASQPQNATRMEVDMDLDNITFLQVTMLNMICKCKRCMESIDFSFPIQQIDFKDNVSKNVSCQKCHTTVTLTFFPGAIHANCRCIGSVQCEGGIPFDLLPCNYNATCANCDTIASFKSLPRAESLSRSCSKCFSKLTLKLNNVKFVLPVQARNVRDRPMLPLKKPKLSSLLRDMGITEGQALPKKGTCKHYGRSYRWMRFPCCGKVYPCDQCHDIAMAENPKTVHETQLANRMVCGFCAREQSFNDTCSFCGKELVRKNTDGSGFWEGGQGTRNKAHMRRKEDKKYQGLGKTISRKARDKTHKP